MTTVGRVVALEVGLPWRVLFPDVEHEAASSYLRELIASSNTSPLQRAQCVNRACQRDWTGQTDNDI